MLVSGRVCSKILFQNGSQPFFLCTICFGQNFIATKPPFGHPKWWWIVAESSLGLGSIGNFSQIICQPFAQLYCICIYLYIHLFINIYISSFVIYYMYVIILSVVLTKTRCLGRKKQRRWFLHRRWRSRIWSPILVLGLEASVFSASKMSCWASMKKGPLVGWVI